MREIIGAVDETCLEQMILVCMDLLPGICSWKQWPRIGPTPRKALVEERLTALGAQVLSVVSDRAKALMQLAETGLSA